MAASSAPAAKAALLALLQAAPALGGVQLAYSHPGNSIAQEVVYFHRTIENEVPATLGQMNRLEDYDAEVVVDVVQDGDEPQVAEERCWALVAALENVVRANPTLSGTVMVAQFVGVEMTPEILDGQRLAEAICRVHVQHRK